MRSWSVVAAFVVVLVCPCLNAQSGLKPGAEPCDQAFRHASSTVLRYLENLANQEVPSSINQRRSFVRLRASDYKEKIALATEVILHCESSMAAASEIQATLVHLYHGQPVEAVESSPGATDTAGGQDEVTGAGMKIAVSTLAIAPERRVIGLEFGNADDRATLRLVFKPSKKMIYLTSPSGKEVPTTEPDGFVRVLR